MLIRNSSVRIEEIHKRRSSAVSWSPIDQEDQEYSKHFIFLQVSNDPRKEMNSNNSQPTLWHIKKGRLVQVYLLQELNHDAGRWIQDFYRA